MAAGGGDFQTAVRESLLVCQVCREDFSLDGRPPRLLPCFHCFCQPCLARLEEEEAPLRCPQCRRSFAPGGKWPLDTTRTTLLELPGRGGGGGGGGEGGQERSCQGCSQSAPAQSWCQHCSQALCHHCCQAHAQMNILKDHVLVPLEEAAEAATRSAQAAEKCHKHKTKKLKFYCRDCVEPVCSTCAILLHSGHKMAELEAALEEKRKEVERWCQKVEAALPDFQERAASSGARLQTVDSLLEVRVSQVQTLFSGVVSKVMARQEQVLTDLRAKVKGQRLELEGQHCSDQSRVEAARTMAEHGRRVASLGQPTQLIGQPQKMEEAFGALQESGETTLTIPPVLEVNQSKLPALMIALEDLGDVQFFTCPEFRLAARHKAWSCVDVEGNTLTNQTQYVSGEGESREGEMNGTLATSPAPDTACYWQVRCVATLSACIDGYVFCKMGVCDPRSLRDSPYWHIPSGSETASSVYLRRVGERIDVRPFIEGAGLPDTALLTCPTRDAPMDCTIGFLLDRSHRRLHVIDVAKSRTLVSTKIQTDTPLWPVVCVCPRDECQADVRLELQSGSRMTMSHDRVRLLNSLLSR